MRALVRHVSRRSRRRDALRRKPDGSATRGSSGRPTASRPRGPSEIVAVLESRAAPRSRCTSARTTTTSTPSRRRRRRSARSRARSGSRRWCRPPAISSTCRRTSTCAPATTPARSTSNAKAAEVDRAYIAANEARRRLSGDVLQPQPRLPGVGRDDGGAVRGGEEGGRRARRQRRRRCCARCRCSSRSRAKTLFVLLRFARWDDVLRLPAADAKFPLLTRALAFRPRRRARGARQRWPRPSESARRTPTRARRSSRRAIGATTRRRTCSRSPTPCSTPGSRARSATMPRAIDAWRMAVGREDMLNYNEPADWFYPTRESLGAALLRAKRFDGSRAGVP